MVNTYPTDIKVTMLGTTQTGKTCYMLAMYDTMTTGVEGFTFTTMNEHEDDDLGDAWDQLVFERGSTRWPERNVGDMLYYHFNSYYGFKRLLSFQWVDYRGGAIIESVDDTEDTAEVYEQIKDSSCIFLCISAEYWVSNEHRNEHRRSIRYINRMISRLSDETDNQPAAVILVTKSDLLPDHMRVPNNLIEELKNIYNPFFAEGAGWTTMVCPVRLFSTPTDDPDNANIDPQNIHLPISFAIRSAFEHKVEEERIQLLATNKQESDAREQARQRAEAKRNAWLGLGSIFNRGEIERLIEESNSAIDLPHDELIRLEQAITRIQDKLIRKNQRYIFVDGKELESDES